MNRSFRNFYKKILKHSIVRFLLVSGLNTAFGYGLFSLLVYGGLAHPLALFISTVCGIIFNFKTIGTLVFSDRRPHLFIKFFLVYATIYLLNTTGISYLISLGLNVYIGAAILILPMALAAFFLNRKFVFKK